MTEPDAQTGHHADGAALGERAPGSGAPQGHPFSNPHGNPPQTSAEGASAASPLPPAEELSRYNTVFPGLAERIVSRAEQEQAHRHQSELRALEGDMADTRLGQVLGFLIGLAAIAAGAGTALQGAEWAGSVIGGGGIIGLVWVFVQGRRVQRLRQEHHGVRGRWVPPRQSAGQEDNGVA